MTETEEVPVPDWEEVAIRYGRFLYTVAYRLTGNHDDAQDLAQEVLLRVRRGLETYRPGSMEGWLSRITTNVFLDEVRRRRRRPVDALPDDPDRVLPAAASADQVLAGQTLPDDVQAAIAKLPDEFRVAVVLCDVAGLPYDEIAEITGAPLGTVRSRIHRGRALLRTALTRHGERR
ncbi:MAG: sigma-70 family RNA polymerase sigma factor [Acidimicrobiales bacterium]